MKFLRANKIIRSASQAITLLMVNILCKVDDHCPFQYYCNSHQHCIHDSVFPLSLYPILIYCLFPIASALCNVSGNSFGQYKVILLMDLLNYSESAATVVCYPLIVGTALFNFIVLIFKRHPNKNTSVVDYNIVMIIIPSILYGSTIGALVNKIIPPIIADSLIIVILGAFSVKFFLRYYHFRKQGLQQEAKEKNSQQIQIGETKHQRRADSSGIKQELVGKGDKKYEQIILDEPSGRSSHQTKQIQLAQYNPYQYELTKHLEYEQTYHIPHIIATVIIFIVFEALSFLAQGKIIFFTMCTEYYVIGVSALTVCYFAFVVGMYFYTKRRMYFYRRIQYKYDYQIDSLKFYLLASLGAFFGGFNGGVFGLGSSTTNILSLLFLGVEPVVASATVGFQVVFSGLGSLCEAFATDEITIQVAAFFFLITFVIGGIFSYFANRFVKTLNLNKVNQVLMLIVGFLTGTSTIGMIVNIVLSYNNFGPSYMIASDFNC